LVSREEEEEEEEAAAEDEEEDEDEEEEEEEDEEEEEEEEGPEGEVVDAPPWRGGHRGMMVALLHDLPRTCWGGREQVGRTAGGEYAVRTA
jgi:hypothetical protein